jgi:hypothetical protein
MYRRCFAPIGAKKTWMEINFKERQSALIVLGTEPRYDPLRSEPRFQAMLKELKLN